MTTKRLILVSSFSQWGQSLVEHFASVWNTVVQVYEPPLVPLDEAGAYWSPGCTPGVLKPTPKLSRREAAPHAPGACLDRLVDEEVSGFRVAPRDLRYEV
jgi:hypothetical protein